MTFMYPLGLIGLVGIPIIILIYILMSQYTEQTVSSTYLWHLSEKFLKKKNPLSGLAGIISLILQLLTVAVISLLIAHPVFTLPGAANDYCFVLDTSGSMNTVEGNKTRLDMAKTEICNVIASAADGSSFTLISVSGDTVVVFEGVKNKTTAQELVGKIDGSDAAVKYEELLSAAQSAFDNDTSSLMYLVTDKGYKTHENIELLNVGSSDTDNYAVFNVTYSHSGGGLSVSAEVISYVSDAVLNVTVKVDGQNKATETVPAKAGVKTPVSFEIPILSFESFSVSVDNPDGYSDDNSSVIYNLKSDKTYSTLIISDTGFFFKAVIDALVDSEVVTVTPDEYETVTDKYGLYIFDSYVPEELPEGSVWLINADRSVDNSGFGIRGRMELPGSDTLEKSKSTATATRKLLLGVSGENIYITNYVKYSGMYLNFSTLFTYDSNPIIFAGTNGLGNRQVVFGFDLHESDFALSTDFVILLGNLLEYSFPDVIDVANYTVGEEALVNILANATGYKAQSPSGKDIYIDSSVSTAAIALNEVGTYTVTVTLAGEEISYNIYSGAHPDESEPAGEEEDFSLSGERTYKKIDGEFDPTLILFICLALLFIADWGVYCYDKYQLR